MTEFTPNDATRPKMNDLTYGPMDDDTLTSILQNALYQGVGADLDQLVGERSQALDYYFGRQPVAPALQGRSAAISTDIADTVDALLAQIMPTFASDTTATFEANGEEDEQQAQLESDVCNYFIMEKCDGYKIFYEAIKDALLLKNGIMKVYVDQREKLEIEEYPPLDDEQLLILQAQNPDVEMYFEETDSGIRVKKVRQVRQLKIESVPPEDFVIDAAHRSQNMEGCRFCSQRAVLTQTQLLEMGIDPDIVAELPTYTTDTLTDSLSRNQTDMEDEHEYYEPSSRYIEVWESYMHVDYDGDGIAELRKVLWCQKYVLTNETVPWVPFSCGAPFLNPHRWVGISIFDKLKSLADQKTTFLRQYEDNMVHHNNRRLEAVVSQLHDIQDVVNSRPGGVIRVKQQGAVREIPLSDIGPSCVNMLNYLDKVRSERTGASLDMQSEGLPTGNDTAHGVERQMSFKEQLAGMITKTLAETLVKQVYLLTHKTLQKYFPEQININRNGNWTQANPGEWQPREHVSIDVGMSQGERLRQASSLQQVLQAQMTMMQAGMAGIVTDASKIFNTMMDYCRMSGLDNPAQYWIDPTSPQAAQAAQQQMMAQRQAEQAQAMQANRIISMEEFKAASDAQKDTREHELKVAEQLLKSEDTQDDNQRAWVELEKKYSTDVPGEGE